MKSGIKSIYIVISFKNENPVQTKNLNQSPTLKKSRKLIGQQSEQNVLAVRSQAKM